MPDAEALSERLRALFAVELEEAVAALNEGLLQLAEEGPASATELVTELFRVAHGIKGAAHAADVPAAVSAGRALEEALSDARNDPSIADAAFVDALLPHVDDLARAGEVLAPEPPGTRRPDSVDVDVVSVDAIPRPAPASPGGQASFVRVSTSAVDRVIATTQDLASVAERVADVAARLGTIDTAGSTVLDIRTVADRTAAVAADLLRASERLKGESLALTMEPFRNACDGLARAVHDIAHATGKQVRLEIEGGDIEIDRAVVAALRAPLLHLVRNAVDHGVEAPEAREDRAKPPQGAVVVSAEVSGGRLEISVRDDGRGVDRDAVRAAASGTPSADATADHLEALFFPGVTTVAEPTDHSGRGVGLDAVRAALEALGGSARIAATSPEGTTVRLSAPVTLSLVRVLLVRRAEETFALPAHSVVRLLRVAPEALEHVADQQLLRFADAAVPVVDLLAATGHEVSSGLPSGALLLVLIEAGARRCALAVDEFSAEVEVTVKPVPERLAGFDVFLGLTAIEGGRPAFVLNPAASVARALGGAGQTLRQTSEERPARRSRIVLAEDTLTTRVLERSILESGGYEVLATADGAQAWEVLQREGADLVVSDVDMPKMTGIELCRAIRASARFKDLPVVLITSLATDEDRARGADAGANAYLLKSEFHRGTLLETIERLL